MAGSLNKVQLIGRLGRDPEVRYTQGGTAVANLSIATDESWTDRKSGEKQERTEWHRIVAWDRLAEIAQQYMGKGSLLYVEGSLETRKWQDKDGHDRYTTEIRARNVQMLGGREESGQRPQRDTQGGRSTPEQTVPTDAPGESDDIPF